MSERGGFRFLLFCIAILAAWGVVEWATSEEIEWVPRAQRYHEIGPMTITRDCGGSDGVIYDTSEDRFYICDVPGGSIGGGIPR